MKSSSRSTERAPRDSKRTQRAKAITRDRKAQRAFKYNAGRKRHR